jgi:hypothetical protein
VVDRHHRSISALDRPALDAAAEDFKGTGLVRVVVRDGVRLWQRASLTERPRRDIGAKPQPVQLEEFALNDVAADRARSAELASLDERVRRIVREELAAAGLA